MIFSVSWDSVSPVPICVPLVSESRTIWVTQVSVQCLLLTRRTSDTVGFHSAVSNVRHLGGAAAEKHACHFMFYQMLRTQHNEREALKANIWLAPVPATPLNQLCLTIWGGVEDIENDPEFFYRSYSSVAECGTQAEGGGGLTGTSAVKGHYSNCSLECYNRPMCPCNSKKRLQFHPSLNVTFIFVCYVTPAKSLRVLISPWVVFFKVPSCVFHHLEEST